MAGRDPEGDPQAAPTVGAATALVLVGFDGSETSWDAFSWACGEARRLRGRVVAVFVSSSSDLVLAAVSSALVGIDHSDLRPQRAEALGRELQCYAADRDLDFTFVHTHGDTASELLRLAAAHHADQIVVGRSTRTRHLLAGSLGRRLVGKREAPVVVVVPLAAPAQVSQRAGCPTLESGSPPSCPSCPDRGSHRDHRQAGNGQ